MMWGVLNGLPFYALHKRTSEVSIWLCTEIKIYHPGNFLSQNAGSIIGSFHS